MASGTPNHAVATVISDALGAWTIGTNLFAGPVRQPSPDESPIPIKCVFCLSSGGPEPRRTFGTPQIDQPAVQIRLRWDNKYDFDGGEAAARAIRDAVDNASAGSGYIRCRVTHSEPLYLGEGGDGWPEWSINVELMYLP